MSAAVPGPKARSQRSTSPATPSGAGGGSSCSPSQASIDAQRGRELVQEPLFEARTIRPAADSTVSTRGPTGTMPPQDLPFPYSIAPSSSGISSRSSLELASRPSASAFRTAALASPEPALAVRVEPGLVDVA